MSLLLNALGNANGADYRKLSPAAYLQKAIAVGRDVFRPDANTLVDLLKRIHNNPIRPSDTLLNHYLIATWAKISRVMGPYFEQYLPVVIPLINVYLAIVIACRVSLTSLMQQLFGSREAEDDKVASFGGKSYKNDDGIAGSNINFKESLFRSNGPHSTVSILVQF